MDNKVDWRNISCYQKLSEDFIREHKDKVEWRNISCYQKLSEDFIKEFQDKVNWVLISINQKLSESFIREFQNKVDWFYISVNQKLSKKFIKEFQNKLSWYYISTYQKLSENFIREYKNKVCWYNISIYQKLSESFIREFRCLVIWENISKYQKLSEEFITEFKLKKPENNWLYVTKEEKINYIKKHTNYEIIDDYIIAYKSCRNNNYSKFNFMYKYETGKTYESHCDCNLDNESSFGLSAWTKESAVQYCNEKLLKVKINIDDIGAIVGNKIRCFKLTILEDDLTRKNYGLQ